MLCLSGLSGVAWAVFDNGDFETGTLQGWTTTTFFNFGLTGSAPYSGASITRLSGARDVTSVVGGNSVEPLSLPDAVLGSSATLRVPRFGHYAAVVNFNRKLANANSLVQTAKITASDVDPRDGKVHLRFAYAPVLQDPGHEPWEQPYFFVVLRNVTRGRAVLYERFAYSGQPGVPWQTSGTYRYTDWQLVDMAPGNGALAVGDVVELEVIGASCALGAHAGWVYIDGFGAQVPGLALSATGPEASRPDTRIVYTLTWRNAGNVTLDNVIVRLAMPTQTVFDGVENISGGDCRESGGVVQCTLGTVAPGASGSFGLRAEVAAKATGTLTLGDYGISATDYPELLGPAVLTAITPDDLADLSIVMDNGVSAVAPGDDVTYKIIAANAGPDNVSGAVVTDAMPAVLSGVTWTCTASGGGKCSAKGTGSIADVVEMPKGATLAYVVRGRVATAGTLSNTATISLPQYVTDTDTTNNTYTDVDPVVTNRAPVTTADAYTTAEDVPLVIAAPGVLANDSDPDNDAITALLVSAPAHGALSLSATGAFTYVPAANYSGSDTFTYRARDAQVDGPAVAVSLVVAAVNDTPAGVADSYALVGGRLDVPSPGVLANDTDIDSLALSSAVVSGPTHGTLALNATGGFSYTAASGYVGADQFTYAPSDGQASGAAVTVTLQSHGPRAAADRYSTNEDHQLVVPAPGLTSNDGDTLGAPLAVELVSAPADGTLHFDAQGGFTYSPPADWSGTATFAYAVTSTNGRSTPATVTIDVVPGDDVPTAQADTYTTAEGRVFDVAAPGVLVNDTDPDGTPIGAVLVTPPAHGTVALAGDGSFRYVPAVGHVGRDTFVYAAIASGATSAPVTVTIDTNGPAGTAESYTTAEDTALTVAAPGVLANDVDAAGGTLTAVVASGPLHGTLTLAPDGGLVYQPAPDYSGPDGFTYRPTNPRVSGAEVTVTLQVTAVNDTPVGQEDRYQAMQGGRLDVAAPGVLGNDTDVEGGGLTVVVQTPPAHGTLALAATGAFTYVPDASYTGRDAFTYVVSDGAATATVPVTLTVVGPTGASETYTTAEDTPLTVAAPGVLANDSAPGGVVRARLVQAPARGTLHLDADGGFTYTPAPDAHGPEAFTYVPGDGTVEGPAVTVTLRVTAVNDAPVAQADRYATVLGQPLVVAAAGVLGNDADADGDALSSEIVTLPAHGTLRLAADGGFTFEPAAGFTGADGFVYRASDGQAASADVRVGVTVRGPASRTDHYTTAEDVALTIDAPGVLGNDASVDAAGLQAVLASAPSHGTLDLGADGRFSYVPSRHWHGIDTFSYFARDEAASAPPVTVQVVVTPVDDPPLGAADRYAATRNRPLDVAAPGVLANDSDADGDAVVAEAASAPAHGTVVIQANGAFVYTPAAGYVGDDAFSYRPRAGALAGDPVTVGLTVQGVVSADDTYATSEDEALVVAAPGVLANDRDATGRAMAAHVRNAPAHGTLVLAPGGGFRYVPAENFAGTDRFTYVPDNGLDAADEATVTITVTAADDAPAGAADSYVVARGRTLRVAAPGVLENDRDVEGARLTAIVLEQPRQGTLSLEADGAFVYVSQGGGPADSFSYRPVADGTAGAPVVVSIAVGGPAAEADAYTLSEDTELAVPAPGVLANDASDAQGIQSVLVSAPAHGTLVLMPSGGFTYRPHANFAGADHFTYAAMADGVRAAPVAVALTITAVNDLPTSAPDHFVVSRGFPLAVTAAGVLANDADVDGDAIEAKLVAAPRHGTLRFGADGAFTFTPAADYAGHDSFTYVPVDAHGAGPLTTVTFDIRGALATADAYRAVRDTAKQIAAPGVLANDVAVGGGAALTAHLVRGPLHGTVALEPNGAFLYTPGPGFEGTDTFAYAAADGSGAGSSADVTIEIGPPPSGIDTVGDLYNAREDRAVVVAAPGLLANDLAPGDIAARIVTPPGSGTVTVERDGGFTYTPSPGFTGVDRFAYEAFDNERVSAPAVVQVVVNNLDDARFFAEGLNDGVFATWLTLANPTANATSALLTFMPSVGDPVLFEVPLPEARRTTVFTAGVPGLPPGPFSVRLDAPDEITGSRSLVWDAGAAGESALKAAPTWYLAEGATFAPFEMFYLVANPGDQPVDVRITYLTPGATITRVHRVAPLGRTTVWVDREAPELAAAEVAAVVSSVDGAPIVVERAVYVVGADGRYRGGHAGGGASTVSPVWYFAEGAALNGVDTYVLVLNPGTEPADVRVTASTDAGASVAVTRRVAPGSRETVRMGDLPGLDGTSFSIVVESSDGVGVVAERAAWWPTDGSGPWGEGHVAIGQLATSHEWIMAEGLSGGEYDADTYALIFNPSGFDGRVRVRLFFEDGHPAVGAEFPIAANSRLTVRVADAFPDLSERRFGIAVESLGPARVPLVVEQAVYWRLGGAAFGAGMSAPARAVPDGGLATVAGAAPAVR